MYKHLSVHMNTTVTRPYFLIGIPLKVFFGSRKGFFHVPYYTENGLFENFKLFFNLYNLVNIIISMYLFNQNYFINH